MSTPVDYIIVSEWNGKRSIPLHRSYEYRITAHAVHFELRLSSIRVANLSKLWNATGACSRERISLLVA